MKLEDMPVVTVEEVLRFRAEAIKQRNELSAVVERQREFLAQVAKQIAEKPDYWSSCGQCERNSSDAEDLIEITPATALRLHDAEVLERLQHRLSALADGFIVSARRAHWQEVIDTIKSDAARLPAGAEGR